MKKQICQRVILCSLAVLLVLCLGAGVIGLSFAGASIVPKEDISLRQPTFTTLDVSLSGSSSRTEMDPTKLYDRACRQTVYIYLNLKDESGNDHTVSGSGIIVSHDGYILTNAHCVSDAKSAGLPMQVELYDGRTFTGTIVGTDPETDVALLKIEANGLQAASLSTAKLKNCQTIYVMGHPDIDLKYTMTSGIVSGQDRKVDFSDGNELKMFQIDAAVNPGNSGGPVYDIYGAVVGMVTAKYMSLTSEGLGFAIPIQDAVTIAGDLKEFGYVKGRPLLGITAIGVKEGQLKAGSPAGVMIHSADKGLPGELAGFIKGDIIVSIDGKTVSSMEDLTRIKKEYKAGDTVKIRFWRDGEYLDTYMTFAEVTPEHPTGPVEIEEENAGPSEWDLPPESDGDTDTEDNGNEEEAPAEDGAEVEVES